VGDLLPAGPVGEGSSEEGGDGEASGRVGDAVAAGTVGAQEWFDGSVEGVGGKRDGCQEEGEGEGASHGSSLSIIVWIGYNALLSAFRRTSYFFTEPMGMPSY